MKKVVLHSKERVFDSFFKIDEVYVSYEQFDGQMSPAIRRLIFERGDSVATLIYNRDAGTVLLIEQFRMPTYEKGPGWILETVAGVLEEGETPEAAVRREVVEEIGYEVETLEPIVTFYVSPGGTSERIILYYAEIVNAGKIEQGGGIDDEDIRLVEYTLDEVREHLAAGRINDAKTLIGILWLLRRLDAAQSI